jgi:hypothetical protein
MTTMSTISGGSEHHPTAWYAEMSSAERKTCANLKASKIVPCKWKELIPTAVFVALARL